MIKTMKISQISLAAQEGIASTTEVPMDVRNSNVPKPDKFRIVWSRH